jgi:hypothetical protein
MSASTLLRRTTNSIMFHVSFRADGLGLHDGRPDGRPDEAVSAGSVAE